MDDTRKIKQLLSDLPDGLEIRLQPGLKKPYEVAGNTLLIQPAAWEEWKREAKERKPWGK
jgi:hypothetical protein